MLFWELQKQSETLGFFDPHFIFRSIAKEMKLTTRGRYGLRALIDLALHEMEGAVSTTSIAKRQEISESYLEQLIRSMKKAGLVDSIRGAGGGYKLARPASKISVGDILRALEGSLDAVSCPALQLERTSDQGEKLAPLMISGEAVDPAALLAGGCAGSDYCVTKYVWKRINDAITETVDAIMLDQLVDESRQMQKTGAKPLSCPN